MNRRLTPFFKIYCVHPPAERKRNVPGFSSNEKILQKSLTLSNPLGQVYKREKYEIKDTRHMFF